MTFDFTKAASVVTALGVVGAGYAYLETFAKKNTVVAVEKRLDQKIIGDKRDQLQQELWRLQDRYGKNCEQGDKTIRDRCRAIIKQLIEAQEELEQLRKK